MQLVPAMIDRRAFYVTTILKHPVLNKRMPDWTEIISGQFFETRINVTVYMVGIIYLYTYNNVVCV